VSPFQPLQQRIAQRTGVSGATGAGAGDLLPNRSTGLSAPSSPVAAGSAVGSAAAAADAAAGGDGESSLF